MKKSTFAVLVVTSVMTVLTSCNEKLPQLSEDPIATIGHGSILDKEGNQIRLTEKFIKQVQELYIRKLSDAKLAVREGSTFDEQKIKATKRLIYETVSNDVLANALFIDWLIAQRKPVDEAHFSIVSNALRWHYVLNIQENPILPDENKRWSRGIPDDEAQKLEENGITVYYITNSGMEAYCDECLEAGVPVPANMFGNEWIPLGSFDPEEFISDKEEIEVGIIVNLIPELMIYVSDDPEGFCLALPRYIDRGVKDEAFLFGVICLGTRTSKACFFDNPKGTFFRKDEVIDFRSNFIGGTDLTMNGQGTCSDCHAGENPYVIHPLLPPFAKIVDDDHVPSQCRFLKRVL